MPAKKPVKRPDLKKRLDQIRGENTSENTVELIVSLDQPLYNTLIRLAAEQNQPVAACAADLIAAALSNLAEEQVHLFYKCTYFSEPDGVRFSR